VTDTAVRIERIFHDALGVAVPSPTTDIIATGVLDSLALVTLLYELEQEFSVTIPLDLDIESLRTIERLAELVDRTSFDRGAPT
jgi:acyl carrier protein